MCSAVLRGFRAAGLRALRTVFNRRQLRHGDKVVDRDIRVPRSVRSDQWDTRACQVVAYAHVGGRFGPRGEEHCALGETHRLAELVSAVAAVHVAAQSRGLAEILADCRAGKFAGLVLQRGYDATPWITRFGALQSIVFPWARYFVKEGTGQDERWKVPARFSLAAKWARAALHAAPACDRCRRKPVHTQVVTLDQWRELHKGSVPGVGCLDLLAQMVELSWVSLNGEVDRGDILVPPTFLQSGRASTIFAAVERSIPQLSCAEIKVAPKVPRCLRVDKGIQMVLGCFLYTDVCVLLRFRVVFKPADCGQEPPRSPAAPRPSWVSAMCNWVVRCWCVCVPPGVRMLEFPTNFLKCTRGPACCEQRGGRQEAQQGPRSHTGLIAHNTLAPGFSGQLQNDR